MERQVINRLQTVIDKNEYTEQVITGTKTITDKPAYDEEVIDYYVCSVCGEMQ